MRCARCVWFLIKCKWDIKCEKGDRAVTVIGFVFETYIWKQSRRLVIIIELARKLKKSTLTLLICDTINGTQFFVDIRIVILVSNRGKLTKTFPGEKLRFSLTLLWEDLNLSITFSDYDRCRHFLLIQSQSVGKVCSSSFQSATIFKKWKIPIAGNIVQITDRD